MFRKRRKAQSVMDFRLGRIGPNTKKNLNPACGCCGYDADWIIAIVGEDEDGMSKHIERFFCERDMRDALLDAMNFSCFVPDAYESPQAA